MFIDAIETGRQADLDQARLTARMIKSALQGDDMAMETTRDNPQGRDRYSTFSGQRMDGQDLIRKMGKWRNKARGSDE